MRSHVAAGLFGLGSIFLAFGAVVFVISFAASRADAHRNVTGMHTLGAESMVCGAILVGLGFLLSRSGRNRVAGNG